ncbi:MAG: hypothetical protein E7328_03205 [Clostridiales bacterium]|nr:hypothetical protein [Clostridiales bacterium]
MICTFMGHGDAPPDVVPLLTDVLSQLIRCHPNACFYLGTHGNFDAYAAMVLHALKQEYPGIRCYRILAYYPVKTCEGEGFPILMPDGLERIPKRFAISHRNRWMIKEADCVIGYVARSYGGAAQFFQYAQHLQKMCINLAK